MTGTRPVVDFMFADFVLDAVGEIVNQIAKMQYMSSGRLTMPMLLRGCIGIGHSAATHHSGNYYPMYAHFPGLRVVVPSTPTTPRDCSNGAALRRPGALSRTSRVARHQGTGAGGDYEIDFGQAAVVREGQRRDRGGPGADGAAYAQGVRAVGEGRHLGGVDRPAHRRRRWTSTPSSHRCARRAGC